MIISSEKQKLGSATTLTQSLFGSYFSDIFNVSLRKYHFILLISFRLGSPGFIKPSGFFWAPLQPYNLGGVYMTPGRLSRRGEFTPVPSHGSTFVYMIPPQKVMPAREFHSGTKSRNGIM